MTETFSVAWADPADANFAWRRDRWHAPNAITTLAGDLATVVSRGFKRAFKANGSPIYVEFQRIHGHLYLAPKPFALAGPAGLENVEPQPAPYENHATWDRVWLPEVQGYHARWEAFDRRRATAPELLAHIQESVEMAVRCWEIHHRLHFGVEGLLAFTSEHLGWDEPTTQRLLAGQTNKSLESDERLRELTELVRGSASLAPIFLKNTAAETLDQIPSDDDGVTFREGLGRFLEEFGRRNDNEFDPSSPSWRDDPTPVIAMIRASISQPARDHAAMRQRLVDARLAAEQEAQALLAGAPQAVRDAFARELTHARRAAELNETHNYWIDQQISYWMQQNYLAAGRLLVERGVIGERDDIFHLSHAEIVAALGGNLDSRASVVAERKTEMERFRQTPPPLELGATLPAEVANQMAVVFGGHEVSTVAGEVHGQPASPGVVTGIARIVLTLRDADEIEEGDILVTKTTSPPWTPLFGIAAAVVTDAGGRLSHCGVVAREYGIPAVVGCVDATERIADGARIRVDGDTGVVTLL